MSKPTTKRANYKDYGAVGATNPPNKNASRNRVRHTSGSKRANTNRLRTNQKNAQTRRRNNSKVNIGG